ncbi:hypothetical protein [Streptococcus dentiloxodontae]
MTQLKLLGQKYGVALAIVSFAVLLVAPQIISGQVIIGSDSIFHYNRFYDAAMQIKEGNISYFISLYGFQQSGRIVNALYGPFFAYIQGILVLVSGTWYRYQILSRIILHILGASSMYALLKQCKLKTNIALPIALLYVTTFSIQYWTMRQGFSSWGAAFLPFCFIPAIRFTFYKKIEPVRLAVSVALIFQVHVLSSLILVIMYIPFFLYGFIKTDQKLTVIYKGILAAVLFLLLTSNIWTIILYLNSQNHLLDPFINETMGRNGIDGTSKYWLYTPISLVPLLALQVIYLFVRWRKLANWKRVLHLIYLFFILLSTSFFPWQYLVNNGNKLAQLIQFPFRFFVPSTILLLVITGLTFNRFVKWRKTISIVLCLFVFAGLVQNIEMTTQKAKEAVDKEYVLKPKLHVYIKTNYSSLQKSLHDTDLSIFLSDIIKTTPDYIPIYSGTEHQDTYNLYYKHVVNNDSKFTKAVKGDSLVLTWISDKEEKIEASIVKYADTELILNGKVLTDNMYALSAIGTPTVSSQKGKNSLIVKFKQPKWTDFIIGITILLWFTVCLYSVYTYIRQKKPAM